MNEAQARRTVFHYVNELEGQAIAHQGQRIGDYDEAVRHYRRRARVLRMVLNAVDGATLVRILTETGALDEGS